MYPRAIPQALRVLATAGAAAASAYHRAQLSGAEHLPTGPALLVGNHGFYGYETPVFFYLLLRATRRYPLGLAERGFYRIPLVRDALSCLGGVYGTQENAVQALRRGHLVVCYPGGALEVFKSPRHRYLLRWERSLGFIRAAAEAGACIVPFGAHGVDDTFAVSDSWRVRWRDDPKYAVPVGMGLGPVPFPTRLHFALGAPMHPPQVGAERHALVAFRENVANTVRALLVKASHG